MCLHYLFLSFICESEGDETQDGAVAGLKSLGSWVTDLPADLHWIEMNEK